MQITGAQANPNATIDEKKQQNWTLYMTLYISMMKFDRSSILILIIYNIIHNLLFFVYDLHEAQDSGMNIREVT